MKKEYDQIMEKIEVTDAMRQRVLAGVAQADLSPARKPVAVRRYLSLAACFVVLLAGAVALPQLLRQPETPPVQVIPDIVAYDTAGQLAQAVGFEVPEAAGGLPFQAEEILYLAYWKELAEIQYLAGENKAVYRKTAGETDPSGDYTVYDGQTQIAAGGLSVTLKGNGVLYQLALWSQDGYSCSLRLSSPLDEAGWTALLDGIG